MLTLLKCSV